MGFGGASDHILQQARSARRANTGVADEKLWARIGDSEGYVRASGLSDHVYIHYLGWVEPDHTVVPGELMLARNMTGHQYEAGDIVEVEWMDDGGASMLRIVDRKPIVLTPVSHTAIAHVGGIDRADPENFQEATLSISEETAHPRLASAFAIRVPPLPYQGVCAHPTEYHSYYMVCIHRATVIEVKHGLARTVAGAEQMNEFYAGHPPSEDGLPAYGQPSVQIRPRGVVAASDGTIYVLCLPGIGNGDEGAAMIGRFQVGGTWTWVFNRNAEAGYGGDGGAASAASGSVTQMALGGDGSLYFTDQTYKVVRKIAAPVSAASIITRVAGVDPATGPPDPIPPLGDALACPLLNPVALTVDPATDTIYLGDKPVIYEIANGAIAVFAGSLTESLPSPPQTPGSTADKSAINWEPESMAWGPNGGLYVCNGAIVNYNTQRTINVIYGVADPKAYKVEYLAGNGDFSADKYPIPSLTVTVPSVYQGSTLLPYPLAPVNAANSLSFDLSGDLYFTDPTRLVVRKLTDEEPWVTVGYNSPTSLAIFRPDGTYDRVTPINSSGVAPVHTAELDTNRKLVGIVRQFISSSGLYHYYVRVLMYSELEQQGRWGIVNEGVPLVPFNGIAMTGTERSPDVYYFDQIFFVTLNGVFMVFNRAAVDRVDVYRLEPTAPPPNEGLEPRYHLVLYDQLAVPAFEGWNYAFSSSTHGSIVYIVVERRHYFTYYGEERIGFSWVLQAYDGKRLYDVHGHLSSMGIQLAQTDVGDVYYVGGIRAHLWTWTFSAPTTATIQGVVSLYERIRSGMEGASYFPYARSGWHDSVQFYHAWYAGNSSVFFLQPVPTGATHEFGEPRPEEHYGYIIKAPMSGEIGQYFVLTHGSGGFASPMSLGSQFLLFRGGAPNVGMPMAVWAATGDGGLIKVFEASVFPSVSFPYQNPTRASKFYVINAADRFLDRIGG